MFKKIIFLLSIVLSFSAHAYRVQPMVSEIEPIGKNSQMVMRVDNTSSQPLTVELIPLSMTMDEMGNETTEPADSELLVIPVTAVIEPGRSQSVMIRYLGNPSISQSKTFRVKVKQVQVERASNEAPNVGLLLEFNTLVNVKPKNTSPKLSVTKVKDHGDNWLVEVENQGTSYGRLNKTNWNISDSGHSLFVSGDELRELVAGTLILPKSKRNFVMKPIDGFDVNSLSIDIKLAD